MIGAKYFLKGSDFLSKWGIGILSLYSFVSWVNKFCIKLIIEIFEQWFVSTITSR